MLCVLHLTLCTRVLSAAILAVAHSCSELSFALTLLLMPQCVQVHASVEADEVSEDEAMKRLNWTSKPGQAESKGGVGSARFDHASSLTLLFDPASCLVLSKLGLMRMLPPF